MRKKRRGERIGVRVERKDGTGFGGGGGGDEVTACEGEPSVSHSPCNNVSPVPVGLSLV